MSYATLISAVMLLTAEPGAAVESAESGTATEPPAEAAGLEVMTFNLRYASERPPHSWPERRPVMVELLKEYAPDIIGTQEGLHGQLQDLAADLPDYRWIGVGREGGTRGEFMAVFYRWKELEPLESGHFWLSDTPEAAGSKTWGNSLPRMATWVKFQHSASQRQFYVFNTHLDHLSPSARERSAALLLERVQQLKTELPVLLIGDFNALPGANRVYETLVGEEAFHDAWTCAPKRGEVAGTFHGFLGPRDDLPRIDWVLFRGGLEPLEAEVITLSKDRQYPSDHFPLLVRLRFTPQVSAERRPADSKIEMSIDGRTRHLRR